MSRPDESAASEQLGAGSWEQIVDSLPADQWSIIAADARTRTSRRPGGDGPVMLDDVVVHARRQAVCRP